MKTKITLMLVLFLVIASAQTQAELIWDSGHHVFSEGREGDIYMLNDATADIIGGSIGEIRMYDSTSADISGGNISILWGQNESEVVVHNGSDIGLLRPHDFSTASVYGGDINSLFTLGSSYTKVYSGDINLMHAVELSEIDLYVDSYVWDPTGGTWGDGLLTGIWWNNSGSFSIEITNLDTMNHINFVPEPGIGILMTIGWFITNRRKTLRCHKQ